MFWVIQGLQALLGLISFVCFILVLVRMFQTGQTGLGVVCIVLFFCVGIGALIAFIMGWINANRWGIQNIMMAWTVVVILEIVLAIIGVVAAPRVIVVG